ncbi:MAG: hypothetical protein KDH96_05650, partial [Candidatus Riesia sp.]|nr:hypothetical protein [Candidatus Riesia sp.]
HKRYMPKDYGYKDSQTCSVIVDAEIREFYKAYAKEKGMSFSRICGVILTNFAESIMEARANEHPE